MTTHTLFSVIIPTHNRLEMLQRALRSVAAQSMDDYEIVVVDDGSSDGTAEYLASVASDRLRAFRNDPNRGVSASRNRGCLEARGDFFVFLDDDDEFRPSALALLREKILATPAVDFVWGARRIHEKNAEGLTVGSRDDDWSTLPCPVGGTRFLPFVLEIATNAAFTIRRSVFEKLGGFDERLKVSEDRDLFIRLARNDYQGWVVTPIIIDIDEHFKDSLSRNLGFRAGPHIDLSVIEKHREFLELPEHRQFLNRYLLVVFCGFLHAGDRRSAMRIVGELRKRHALNRRVLRMYLRHAQEFRALKALFRYAPMRRLKNKLFNGRVLG